jgi:hypothetical protein
VSEAHIEHWRPIPGYEGYYEVSDQGRVRSVDRLIRGRYGNLRPAKGRVLTPAFTRGTRGSPYPIVSLYRDGVSKNFTVHRAVMLAFIGPCPDGMITRHLNGNSLDSRLSNLAYGTHAENVADSIKHGTYRPNLAGRPMTTVCPWGHQYQSNKKPGDYCKTCSNERRRERRAARKRAEGVA